jgi:hypothetical protein
VATGVHRSFDLRDNHPSASSAGRGATQPSIEGS